jgi:hypothetical protein
MIIQKITAGFVTQSFDTEAQRWIEQNFTAGDTSACEVCGEEICAERFSELAGGNSYLPFDMVQPLPLNPNLFKGGTPAQTFDPLDSIDDGEPHTPDVSLEGDFTPEQ